MGGNSNPCKALLLLHTQMGTWVQYRKTSGGGCAIKECRYQNIKAWKVQRIISTRLKLQQEYSCCGKKKEKDQLPQSLCGHKLTRQLDILNENVKKLN